MPNRRDEDRQRRRLNVRFGVQEPTTAAHTGNVSARGFSIVTNKVFAPGTVLAVELKLPSGELVRTQAMVAWARRAPPGLNVGTILGMMGLRFLSPPDQRYAAFVEERSAAPKG
jgi:hypothetical protein